jgi:hypothetical protein
MALEALALCHRGKTLEDDDVVETNRMRGHPRR